MDGQHTVVTRHLASGYVTVSRTYDELDAAVARREELVSIREDGEQVFHCAIVSWLA
jgi:hypothetical protein